MAKVDSESSVILAEKKSFSKEKKLQVVNKVKTLLEGSTSHGIPNIIRTNRISIKTLWTVCFLAALGSCSYMVIKSVTDYLEYDTVSKIEYITEIPTKFPTISFCNTNPLMTNVSQQLVEDLLPFYGFNNSSEFITDSKQQFSIFNPANSAALLNASDPSFGDENRKQLGYDLAKSLLLCRWNDEFCRIDGLEWYFDLTLGNCFRFNSGKDLYGNQTKLKESVKAGSKNGLKLQFYLKPSSNRYSSTLSEGMRVFIHNNSIIPSYSEGVNVEPSKITDIAIQRTFIQKEPYPYSDCIDLANLNSDYYKFLIGLNRAYRQQDCFDLCLQKKIIENCRCYDMNYPMISNSTPCKFENLGCTNLMYTLFKNNTIDDSCMKQCPLECESIKYDVLLSNNVVLSKQSYELFKSSIDHFVNTNNEFNLTYEEIKQRYLFLNIYYSELSFIKISESPKTSIIDLLSNLGGTLGLYVGISFLSFIEIVEIILEIIFISFDFNN
jgi:hypothetical protein